MCIQAVIYWLYTYRHGLIIGLMFLTSDADFHGIITSSIAMAKPSVYVFHQRGMPKDGDSYIKKSSFENLSQPVLGT